MYNVLITSIITLYFLTILANNFYRIINLYHSISIIYYKKNRKIFTIINTDNYYIRLNTFEDFNNFYEKLEINDDFEIILHTPGGDLGSSEAIFKCISRHKGKVTAYIPQYCYSGGMLIALSCDKIFMNRNTLVGPCDAQLADKKTFSYTSSDVIQKVIAEKQKLGQDVKEEWLAQGYEATKVKSTQQQILKELLSFANNKKNYNENIIDKIYEELFSGKYPHSYSLDFDNLMKIGINVEIKPFPNYIKQIFRHSVSIKNYSFAY